MNFSWIALGYPTRHRCRKLRPVVAALAFLAAALPGLSAQRPAPGEKSQLHVAAAADLTPVMPVLAQMYERKTGIHLVVTTGSSGSLVTQIENGLPADIFLGADFTFPEKLVAEGLADSKAPTAYARGSLVLFARKDSPLQPLSLERLQDPRAQKIAIANQLHAPFGRAAEAALNNMNLLKSVQPRLVIAENVAQAGQFVESGNAQLGFVSLTLASSQHFKEIGTYVLVPASQYPEIRQCAVVLSKGHPGLAHQFLDWLLSPEIQGQIHNVGLEPVR